MKKRLFSILLVCALALSLMTTSAFAYGEEYEGYDPTSGTAQYSDVPTTNWAYSAIKTCSERSWFNGYADGTFHPDDFIRRDEAAKVFVEALALPWEKDTPVTYTDTEGNWAAGRIEAAKYLFPDTTNLAGTKSFRPTQTITREETIYALVVAWQFAPKTSTADESVLNMFADAQSISASVRPYMAVAVSAGLIHGIPDKDTGKTYISAQKGLTRAEFATMLGRALEIGVSEKTTLDLKLDNFPSSTAQESVVLTGTVTSNHLATIKLTCGGTPIAIAKDGSFSVTLPLTEGSNSFTLDASNGTGLIKTQTVTIKKDTAKAAIRLLSTVPAETTQSSVLANGVVDNYKVDCVLFLDGKKVAVSVDGHFEATLKLAEGANRFELTVERLGIQEAVQSISITRLTTKGAGEWVEKLPDNVTAANYTIETKEQFRTKTREMKTSAQEALEGWTLVKKDGGWGSWSAWQNAAVTAGDGREVESQQVQGDSAHTEYRYHYFQNDAGKRHFCPYYAGWSYEGVYNGGTFKLQYTDWTRTQATLKVNDFKHVRQGASCEKAGCLDASGTIYAYVVSGTYSESNRVFFEEQRQVPSGEVTQYRYRDYSGSNIFEKWSDWSDWKDGTAAGTEAQAETRTLYKFSVK